ncbi:MAG: hypothetical protein JOZ86_13405 [Candidatus Eremiobacteraeota bacterium]|nr:hypothetical protein [Candidatus Eremiobacteraeota bacterium]
MMKTLRASSVAITLGEQPRLVLRLAAAGAEVSFPVARIDSFRRRVAPRRALAGRTAALANVVAADGGSTIEWPDLDVSFSVAEMLPEYLGLSAVVRSASARKAARTKTPARARASRENGKLGGRPRKKAA